MEERYRHLTVPDNSIVIWAASASTGDLIKFTTADNGITFIPEVVTLGVFGGSASVGPLANADFYYNAGGLNPQKFQSNGGTMQIPDLFRAEAVFSAS